MDKQGLLFCARYSVAPNFFGYCGPDENPNLIDHLKENVADKEVISILSEFETLYPYLKFIATENNIPDPFDRKVVEAYWLGNRLLQQVSSVDYMHLIDERLLLEKKMGIKKVIAVKRKIAKYRFYPHHAFHVFNIFKRTGYDLSNHMLETMDACRISFGKVKSQKSLTGQAKVKNAIVEYKPLVFLDNKLQLGLPVEKELKIDYKGKSFHNGLKEGDWISFHWGFVCDVLTLKQIKNLEFYTQQAINFFNKDGPN